MYLFSSLELWVLYCSPPELDNEVGRRVIGEIMKWWWPKAFPISLRNWESVIYAPCSLVNKPCAVQCALLGVSSVCWENWTDTIICRNLATQLSGRLLIIPNQITQKPEIKTSSQQRWGQPRTEWELNAPMGLIRNHGRGNRVGKCLPCTEAELKEAWNHLFGCLSIYHCKSRMHSIRDTKNAAQAA